MLASVTPTAKLCPVRELRTRSFVAHEKRSYQRNHCCLQSDSNRIGGLDSLRCCKSCCVCICHHISSEAEKYAEIDWKDYDNFNDVQHNDLLIFSDYFNFFNF